MSTGPELAEGIRAKIAELKAAFAAVGDADAAPAGRWTPREIISHIAGPEAGGVLRLLSRFLDEDVPRIDLVPEQTYMTEARRAMPLADIVALAAERYEALAAFAAGLSEAQLARTAHIPVFKDRPFGEYPSLGTMLAGFGQFHVGMHIDHLREVLAGR